MAKLKTVPVLELKACKGCGKCSKKCPTKAIEMIKNRDKKGPKKIPLIDPGMCKRCGKCIKKCPKNALSASR